MLCGRAVDVNSLAYEGGAVLNTLPEVLLYQHRPRLLLPAMLSQIFSPQSSQERTYPNKKAVAVKDLTILKAMAIL